MVDLRLAAKAAGTNASALAQRCEGFTFCRDEAIASIFAAANRGKTEARRNIGGNILDTVNSEIDFLVQQSLLKLLDEHPFTANLREGCGLQFVTGGLDDDDFGVDASGLKDFFADEFRLPFGEHAAASADSNGFHGRSRSGRKSSRMASTC